MNYVVLSYSIYLPVAVGLTVWVAKSLHKNGKIFLVDIFHQQVELAASVNKLLQVGFYLINVGFAFMRLQISPVRWAYNENSHSGVPEYDINSVQKVIEILSYKLGGFIILLGVMLFIYLLLLLVLRSGSKPAPQPLVKVNNPIAV